MADERPEVAPKRLIINYGEWLEFRPNYRRVKLECGHDKVVAGFEYETLCFKCLNEEQKTWDLAHCCKHGIVIQAPEDCLKCEVADLRLLLEERTTELRLLKQLLTSMQKDLALQKLRNLPAFPTRPSLGSIAGDSDSVLAESPCNGCDGECQGCPAAAEGGDER